MSRIEQLIDEIEEFVESCKSQPFSQTKVIVPKDELFELLTELRLKTPDEIKRYQKIIANKDKIISDAQAQAQQMLDETTTYANHLVEEHQIMIKAYERAEEVLNSAQAQAEATINEANMNAEEIRLNALQYTKDMVDNLENIVNGALGVAEEHANGLISGLSQSRQLLLDNKEALESQLSQPVPSTEPPICGQDNRYMDDDDDDNDEYIDDHYDDDDLEPMDDDDDDDDDFDYDDID